MTITFPPVEPTEKFCDLKPEFHQLESCFRRYIATNAVAAAVIRLLSDDQSRSEMTVQARGRTRRKFGLRANRPKGQLSEIPRLRSR